VRAILSFAVTGLHERASTAARGLAADTKAADDVPIPLDVLLTKVIEQVAPFTDEQKKAAAAVVVLGVVPQVLGDVVYPLGIERDLYFGRTGVAFVQPVLLDDLLFFFLRGYHSFELKPAGSEWAVIYTIWHELSRLF